MSETPLTSLVDHLESTDANAKLERVWTVGVAQSGNEMGLSLEEVMALPEVERMNRRSRAAEQLANWGAHYVIDTVADLPGVLEQIEERLLNGDHL